MMVGIQLQLGEKSVGRDGHWRGKQKKFREREITNAIRSEKTRVADRSGRRQETLSSCSVLSGLSPSSLYLTYDSKCQPETLESQEQLLDDV